MSTTKPETPKFEKRLLQNVSGFPEFGPKEAIALRWILDIIRTEYELAGYTPIETPLVEREEVLTKKNQGEVSAQVYGLRLLNPEPDAPTDTKDLALRFDQTVPLARFVAANYGNLFFPFRRYVIGPVFRGERPKDGRYRQFIQADIDVIGNGSLNLLHDAEIVSIISNIFTKLDIGSFTVRIGNRKILQGLLQYVGLPEEKLASASGAIDKLEKIGRDKVIGILISMGVEEEKAKNLIILLTDTRSTDETLTHLKTLEYGALFSEGVLEIERVIAGIRKLGVPEKNFRVDISIARGLDYYTGTVYETRFDAYPSIGSIASGGRYDKLVNTFIDRELPGVGISIGVTRLIIRLMDAGLVKTDAATIAKVLITTAVGVEQGEDVYLAQAKLLRDAHIPTEIYLADKDLGKQLLFADRRGFTIVVVANEENIAAGTVQIRNFKTGVRQTVASSRLVETVQEMLK